MKKIAPHIEYLISRSESASQGDLARAELRALLAVAGAARKEHDPATEEVASDHSHCPVCAALSRLDRAGGGK